MLRLQCFVLFLAVVVIRAEAKSYANQILVSVTPTEEEHYELLLKLENQHNITLWNDLHRNLSAEVMFSRENSSSLLSLFESMNMKPHVVVADVQNLFDAERRTLNVQARAGIKRSARDSFLNYQQTVDWLMGMVRTYPDMASLTSIGKTYENRDIWLIKLTANNGAQKRKAFLDFGIHAREWISPATGNYIIEELLSNYARRSDAKRMLDTWEFHIVPMLNPDGYDYSHTRDRMWRKNRRPIPSSNCIGVDLNRNFGYKWNTGGSSPYACDDTYHGGSAMSENEAKALQQYMTNKNWDTYLTFHSYGQYWFTNWGFNRTLPADYSNLVAKARVGATALKAVNQRTYTIGSSSVLLYVASGGSEDWTRGTLGITYSYCLELPPVGGTGFIVNPSEIKKTGAETYAGVVAYLNAI